MCLGKWGCSFSVSPGIGWPSWVNTAGKVDWINHIQNIIIPEQQSQMLWIETKHLKLPQNKFEQLHNGMRVIKGIEVEVEVEVEVMLLIWLQHLMHFLPEVEAEIEVEVEVMLLLLLLPLFHCHITNLQLNMLLFHTLL
ncbi:hypothetical protein BYT27DRAFT_7216271 [Phlegmacium glaucopus]|nr:hypothetical protein BYT27DRAFT_7216271 [Phlegmacium glaucopus]